MSTIKVDTIATRSGSGSVTVSNNIALATEGQIDINSTNLLVRSTGNKSGLRFDTSAYTPFKNGRAPWNRWSFQHIREILPTTEVWRGTGLPWLLPEAANNLDDYEEGTFAASFGMNGSGSLSMTRNNIAYVKVGRMVTVTGEIMVSSVSSPVGSMTMSLPFTISANGTGRDTFFGSKPVAYHIPHNGDNTPVIVGNSVAASCTFLYETDDGAFANYTPAANETFNLSFSYFTTT